MQGFRLISAYMLYFSTHLMYYMYVDLFDKKGVKSMNSTIYVSLHFPVLYHLERDTTILPAQKRKPILLPSLIAQRLFWHAVAVYCNEAPDENGIYSFPLIEFKHHYKKIMSDARVQSGIDEIHRVEIVSEDGTRYFAFGDERDASDDARKKSMWLRPSKDGTAARGDICFTSQFFDSENLIFKAAELTDEEKENNCVTLDYDFFKELPGKGQNHIVAFYPVFATMKKVLDKNPHGIAFMAASSVLLNGGYLIDDYTFAQYKSFCLKPTIEAFNDMFHYDLYADEIRVYKGDDELDLVAFHQTQWTPEHLRAISASIVPEDDVE